MSAVWALDGGRRTLDGTAVAVPAVGASADEVSAGREKPHDAVVALLTPRGVACSGVLVAARWVLTARHCRGVTKVVFGADVVEPRLVRSVSGFHAAPTPWLDVALLELSEGVTVEPYRLYVQAMPPRQVRVVGFGCTDSECRVRPGRRSFFDALLRAGSWGCDAANAAQLQCLADQEMAIGRQKGADTCTGDSGGAVLTYVEGAWQVVAITSRAIANGVLRCGDGGIYVRARAEMTWINSRIGS